MFGKLFFDGSNDPKGVKPASAGFVLYTYLTEEKRTLGEYNGRFASTLPVPEHLPQTNNSAEYTGLIAGLARALTLGVTNLEVIGDSQLVIYQVLGSWRCKMPHLKPLLEKAHHLNRKFDKITYEWKRRKHNEADAVSRLE